MQKMMKNTLALSLLVALTACGSSGGNGANSATTTPAISTNNAEVETLKAQLATAQTNLAQSEKDKTATAQQLTAAQADLAKARENLAQLEKDKTATAQQLTAARAELTKAKENLAQLEKDKTVTAQQLTAAQADLVKAQENVAQLEKDKTATAQQLTAARAELTKAKENLAQLEKDKTATAQQLTAARADLAKAKESIAKAEKAAATATEALKQSQTALLAETQAKNNLTAQLTKANSDLIAAQNNLAQLEKDKTATAEQLQKAKDDLAKAETDKATVAEQLTKKEKIINTINAEIDKQLKLRSTEWIEIEAVSVEQNVVTKTYRFALSPTVTSDGTPGDGLISAERWVYRTPYFTLNTQSWNFGSAYDEVPENLGSFRVQHIEGERTATLPAAGTATYQGKAFNADKQGDFNYNVDFANKTGSGSVTNIAGFEDIPLAQAQFYGSSIKGSGKLTDSTTEVKYTLEFFGSNAEALAGDVYVDKLLDGAVKTNGSTMRKYGYNSDSTHRGTAIAVGGERGDIAQ